MDMGVESKVLKIYLTGKRDRLRAIGVCLQQESLAFTLELRARLAIKLQYVDLNNPLLVKT